MSNQFEYFDYEIDGVEAYSTVLSEASFEVSQLEPGTLRGHHTRLRLPESEISWVKTNLMLRGRGNLRRMRLGAARSSILQSKGDGKTISEIAINHGFWHLSRFADQYREMFGESPSETKSRYLLGQAD